LSLTLILPKINASATISAAPAGSNFNYTLALNNWSTSKSGIGTFWHAWVPGEDFVAASPISVTPPSGWTDTITHAGDRSGSLIVNYPPPSGSVSRGPTGLSPDS
jgi:hypothetical protein